MAFFHFCTRDRAPILEHSECKFAAGLRHLEIGVLFITKEYGDWTMGDKLKKWVEKNVRLLGAIGIAIVIAIAVIANHKTQNLNTQVADTQPTNASSSSTVNDSSSSTPAPTTAQQVTSWYNQYGSNITNLTNDFAKMSKEGTNSNQVEVTCTQIFDDATKAQAQPVIPDSSINIDWQSALKSYISAAQDCQDGTTNQDSSEISRATTEFSQGNASLTATASAIQKLRG